MTDELKIARRVRKSLRRIGIASTISVKGDVTMISGKDRSGKPFNVRIGRCADNMDKLDAFDRLRTFPREPGDSTSFWCPNHTPKGGVADTSADQVQISLSSQ
jgi:hypothetical protein